MRKKMLISSPGQELTSNYKCPRVGVKISGIDFLVDLIVVKTTRIDAILGGDWLKQYMEEIHPAEGIVFLRTPIEDKIKYKVVPLKERENEVSQQAMTASEKTIVASNHTKEAHLKLATSKVNLQIRTLRYGEVP
jgi:hypothetical protein